MKLLSSNSRTIFWKSTFVCASVICLALASLGQFLPVNSLPNGLSVQSLSHQALDITKAINPFAVADAQAAPAESGP